MDFRSIALNYLSGHLEFRSCPDQYLGKVSEIEEMQSIYKRQTVEVRPKNERCLLLVLESPHVKEFEGELGPAKGITGNNIVKYLRGVPDLESFGGYGLILINAVQYQCSLGYATQKYRDDVFKDIWNNGGKTDFMIRLKAVYQSGDKLISCCTKGSSRIAQQELRYLVQCAIKEAIPDEIVYRRNHPSFWHFLSNRKREWKLPPNDSDTPAL